MKKDYKGITRARALHKKGLSLRNIGSIMGKDVKTIWRWLHYTIDKK